LNILLQAILTISLLFFNACSTKEKSLTTIKNTTQADIQIVSLANKNGTITPRNIEEAFDSVGLSVVGNNNMNIPFQKRFHHAHYKVYNLAMFMNSELSYKLLKKYPTFGVLTPLTMSIYQKEDTIYIATLTHHAMARAAAISEDDKDLQAYSALITKALKKALPNGKVKRLSSATQTNESLQLHFTTDVKLDKGKDIEEYIEDFEAEFEGEMEPLGFLFPNFTNIQEELFDEYGEESYDFYHTYSICKFDVIYPVSKLYPEAGAWAPCSFYLYKKKGEKTMHMGFLSVQNWIQSLQINDKESKKVLLDAQGVIVKILKDLTE